MAEETLDQGVVVAMADAPLAANARGYYFLSNAEADALRAAALQQNEKWSL